MADDNKKKLVDVPNPPEWMMPVKPGKDLTGTEPIETLAGVGSTIDAYTGQPVRAAALSGLTGQSFKEAYASGAPGKAVSEAFLKKSEELGAPLRAPGQPEFGMTKPLGVAVDFVMDPVLLAAGITPSFIKGIKAEAVPGKELSTFLGNLERQQGRDATQQMLKQLNPDLWEYHYGRATPELQQKLKLTSKDIQEAATEAELVDPKKMKRVTPESTAETVPSIEVPFPEEKQRQRFADGGKAMASTAAFIPTEETHKATKRQVQTGASFPLAETLAKRFNLDFKKMSDADLHKFADQYQAQLGIPPEQRMSINLVGETKPALDDSGVQVGGYVDPNTPIEVYYAGPKTAKMALESITHEINHAIEDRYYGYDTPTRMSKTENLPLLAAEPGHHRMKKAQEVDDMIKMSAIEAIDRGSSVNPDVYKKFPELKDYKPASPPKIPGEIPEDRQNFAEGGIAPPTPHVDTTNINVINPEGELVSLPAGQVQEALTSGYQIAPIARVQQYVKEQKYGSPEQVMKTVAEGVAQGLVGPLATGAERLAGVSPEDIRGREEVNPWAHGVAEAAGFIGGFFTGASEANLLAKAGKAAEGLSGLGKAAEVAKAAGKSGFVQQVGANAVRGATEMALMQAGEEVNKYWKDDPNQVPASVIADMGLATIMGGIGGGAIGAALNKFGKRPPGGLQTADHYNFVSELDMPGVEAGDFATTIRNSDLLKPAEKQGILAGLGKEKVNAGEIRDAAKRLGAPVMEGMVSDSKLVQKAEDALINGAPTYSGLKRQALYSEGYGKASQAVEEVLGDPSRYTKAELGNIMKESITRGIEEQNAPIAQMFEEIKKFNQVLPIADRSTIKLAQELRTMPEFKFAKNLPQGRLISIAADNLANVKTIDDLKNLSKTISGSVSRTAAPEELRAAAIIRDKLTEIEQNSIEKLARRMAMNPEAKALGISERLGQLIEQNQVAKKAYSGFITKVQTLAEQLGKKRIGGAQHAISFIRDELTPEMIVQRLFAKKDSEFMKFFAKEFPEEMKLMQEFQKGALRESNSVAGELSHKKLFKTVNKMEPEIQRSLFTKEELLKLKDAETYINAIPQNFNPSGTANLSAFREFFKHPMGAIVANARDMAVDKFIKAVSASPEVNAGVKLAKAAVSAEKVATKLVKNIVQGTKAAFPAAYNSQNPRTVEQMRKLVASYTEDPDKMTGINENVPLPEHAQFYAMATARAVNYLHAIDPTKAPMSPLDRQIPPTASDKAQYERQLAIAASPMMIFKHIQDGTLTVKDMQTMKVVHPELYRAYATKITSEVIEQHSKGNAIPYSTRLQLSQFLGTPLDSTMTQQGIAAAQGVGNNQRMRQEQQVQATMRRGTPRSTQKLDRAVSRARTPVQAREQEQAEGK